MKILMVHYRYFISGGPERYLFNVKESLEERGHTVIPFSIHNSHNEQSEYEKYFARNIGNSNEVFVDKYPKTVRTYLDLIGREFYSFHVRRKLEKLIRVEKPDICYLLVYKRALSPSVIDACKKYGIPVINRISDYNTVCGAGSLYRNHSTCELCMDKKINCVKYRCIKGSLFFSLMRYASIQLHKLLKFDKKIDFYVCTNQFMAEKMVKYGYEKHKIQVISTFFKEDEKLKNLNKQNQIIPEKIKFLFIGNIDETKGIYDLLDAIAMLRQQVQNFHFSVVGGLHAEENERMKKKIKEYQLEEFITHYSFVAGNEVYRFYLDSNVAVMPTRWYENLPNTLVESIYFNRPVVVPDFGSFQYTTDESVSFRYTALSSGSLYECLLEICNNPDLIKKKSMLCTEYFEENFSEKTHLDRLQALFERNFK